MYDATVVQLNTGRNKMLKGSIEIRTTKVYGNGVIYPACAASQMIANIAGTKTLTPECVAKLLRSGIQVQQVFANGDHLTIDSLTDIAYV